MPGQRILTHQCQNMFKGKLNIIVLLLVSANTYSADIMDIYDRSLKFNADLKIISNEHKISKEIYNQTSSSIFPDINITANTQEVNVNKYTGSGSQKDYDTENASLTIT